MSAVKMDARSFQQRIKSLISYWNKDPESFGHCDSILCVVGNSEDGVVYQKSSCLQNWLFFYEMTDTVLFLTKDTMYVYASAKKTALLLQLQEITLAEQKITVQPFNRSKDAEESQQALKSFISATLAKHTKIGLFPKDKPSGKAIDEWLASFDAFKQANKDVQFVDCSIGVSTVIAVKDDSEIKTLRAAGKMSSLIMKNYFTEETATIIDDELKVTHAKLSEKMENIIHDDKLMRKLQFPDDVAKDFLDFCYAPIVQSGGVYDLKPSASSNNDLLKSGIIICSLGIRYRNYCSNLARTILIDPSSKQEEYYKFLVELQKYVMSLLKDGAVCSDLYAQTVKYVTDKKPDLTSFLVKNLGFVIGIEFRDSNFVLAAKTKRELYKDMSVNLVLGFQDIPLDAAGGEKYSLLLGDTVLVGSAGGGATFLTDAPREFEKVCFFFKDEDGAEADVAAVSKPSPIKEVRATKSAILKTKLRAEARDDNLEKNRKEHQMSLLQRRINEGLSRFSSATEEGTASSTLAYRPVFKKYESYKKDAFLPKEVASLRILIDKKAETVLLPVCGVAVPFHLNTIKNVSKSEEGDAVYLRFNFITPGAIGGGAVAGKKDEAGLPYDDPSATFIRSLSFKSSDTARYTELFRQISEMKKASLKRDAERRQKADLVEQDKLQDNKRPLAILSDVNIRPALEGKKLPGDVQIHANGLRYQPIRGEQRVDILFGNVKHLFFQPCDGELYVILHCHLKHPIMVGKKKTKDVQFIRDVSDANFDETGGRRNKRGNNYGDEDELMAEQEERRRRQKLNKEFKTFAEKIAEVSGGLIEADVPIRELGFSGVPARTNVLMQPTTECLVHLSDMPVTVLTLAEVEIAYLERVQFHLKNFDLVFVLKDFNAQPVHINTIPMQQLEPVKEWLDSIDVPFIEGPFSLNWANIMKNVNQDPAGFYEDGGWINLIDESAGGAGGGGGGSSDEEESASEYEASSVESSDGVESEESSDADDGSDFDEEDSEDASDAGSDDGGGGSDDEVDSEEEDDWDALEAKAKQIDKERKKGKHAGKPAAPAVQLKKAKASGGKRRDESDEESDEDDRPKKKRK